MKRVHMVHFLSVNVIVPARSWRGKTGYTPVKVHRGPLVEVHLVTIGEVKQW